MLTHRKDESEEDEAVWLRNLVLPEEEVIARHPRTRGSPHRWFRSHNVIDLWHYRKTDDRARIYARLNCDR
jgi:hypothetical protein